MGNIQRQLRAQLLHLGASTLTYISADTDRSVDQDMPVISVEIFFEDLNLNKQAIVLVNEKNEDIEEMLNHKFGSLHLLPGVDWFKVA